MPANDPWLDDQFAPLDTRTGPDDRPVATPTPVAELESLPDDQIDGLLSGIKQLRNQTTQAVKRVVYTDVANNNNYIADQGTPQDGTPTITTPEEPDYPKVIELQDGAQIIFERTPRGLRATIDSGTGANAERFYGKDEAELLQQIAVGKLNATKRIHELAKAERLGVQKPDVDPNPPAKVQGKGRVLTADEVNNINLKHKTDPVGAIEDWYKLRHGLAPEDAARGITAGSEANIELYLESVAKSFKIARPQYVAVDENLHVLVGAMCKDFFNESIAPQQVEDACVALARNGLWTVKNLVAYFDGLSEAGLLQMEPPAEDDTVIEEEVVPVARPVAPAPVVPAGRPERIVRPRPGSNASYGIRQVVATAPPAEDQHGPSDEELNDLSDEQIANLFAGVRRVARGRTR